MSNIDDCRRVKQARDLASESCPPKRIAFLFLLTASIALLTRINSFSFIENSLRYEDGIIFLNQSYEFGLKSVLMPYPEYHILYQRIVALLASRLPLEAIPYVFFLAWLMSFFSIVYVLMIRGKSVGLAQSTMMYLVCAIALLPSHGSTLFNLNHSHFFLGTALALYVCIPCAGRPSITEIVFLVLASLTGPYSAFLIPVLVLQLVIIRDFSARKLTYAIVLVCGLIQSACIFYSRRFGYNSIDRDAVHWFKAIFSFVTFGGSSKLTYAAAAVFWALVVLYLGKWMRAGLWKNESVRFISPLFAAATVVISFAAGAFALGRFLPEMSPLDLWGGSRYFILPYSLLFFIVLTITASDWVPHTLAAVLLALICSAAFSVVDLDDGVDSTGLGSYANMQWAAFAKLQRLKPDLLIPINAPLPMYPPPHVRINGVGVADGTSEGILLDSTKNTTSVDDFESSDSGTKVEKGGTVYFNVMNHCEENRYLAIEVAIWRSRMGWASMYWGKPGSFSSDRSLRRFYPSGSVVMQYAFRRGTSDYLIRFDPMEGVPDTAVVRTLNLPGWKKIGSVWKGHGRVIGEPTAPGGGMRIERVRLFCLG